MVNARKPVNSRQSAWSAWSGWSALIAIVREARSTLCCTLGTLGTIGTLYTDSLVLSTRPSRSHFLVLSFSVRVHVRFSGSGSVGPVRRSTWALPAAGA